MATLKRLRTVLLLAAAACLPWNRLHAQESNSLSPSPDSRTLVRDIQNPVDYHTGTVNVQAPLYTVQANGISIPITLSYNTSGIKVNDTPTSTGLGWRLSAGGKITRIVKKYPDEQSRRTAVTYIKNDSTRLYHYNSAWLDYLFKTDSTLNEVYELGVFEYLPNGEREGNIPFFDFDTEPDIFYFEIPGNSGIFVLDNDGGAHTIPYQDLAITFIRGTEPTDNRFTIRDNAGNLYKFGSSAESREVTTATTHDNTNHTNTKTLTYNSTWHLDEIAPFSGEQVLFTYEAGTHANEITTRDWFQIGLYALKEGRYELLQFENDYTTATAAAPKFLRQITWSGGKVVFTYDGITSLKLSTTYQVLKNIATYATTRQTNDIHFDYSFFQNGALKLTAVREQYGNDMLYLYKFRYLDMAAFPANNDSFFDHWGYYNNRGDYGYHDYMPAIEIDGIAVPGHDRTPTANARGNILSGIETGNGFSFTYNYELNSIADAANGDRPFGGLRIASITQLIGNGEQTVRRFEYTLPDGRSSGKAFQDKFRYYDSYPNGPQGEKRILVYSRCINNLYDFGGNHMSYSRVTEYMPNGSYTVYCYDEGIDNLDPEWEYYPTTPALTEAQKNRMEPFAPPTSYFWRRGLLTSQSVYDSDGNLVSGTSTRYAFGEPKAKIKCLVPYTPLQRLFVYYWISEPVYVSKTTTYGSKYSLASETEFTYDTNRMLPTKSVTTDAAGNTYETRIKYAKDYGNITGSTITDRYGMLAAIKQMLDHHAYNLPVETVKYRNGKIVSANLVLYKTLSDNPQRPGVVPATEMAVYTDAPIGHMAFTHSSIYNAPYTSEFRYDSRYEPTVRYDEYDGPTLLSSHAEHGTVQSVMYGYDGTLPVAVVTNAVHSKASGRNQVIYDSFESGANILRSAHAKSGEYVLNGSYSVELKNLKPGRYIVSYWRLPRTSAVPAAWQYVESSMDIGPDTPPFTLPTSSAYVYDELRILPVGAQMTTCAYTPGVGKISETDVNGTTTYYDYNKFGLLKTVRDDDGTVVKRFIYDNYTSNL